MRGLRAGLFFGSTSSVLILFLASPSHAPPRADEGADMSPAEGAGITGINDSGPDLMPVPRYTEVDIQIHDLPIHGMIILCGQKQMRTN